MDALLTQLKFELQRFQAGKNSIQTVFFGGGTPSTISPELYKNVFDLLQDYLQENCEISSEANPNSATREWLAGMKKLGVNRISFGTQSFNDNKLKLLNRAHSAKQAIEAVHNARDLKYENISLDLIYATYGDTKELLEHDIKTALSLPINHLSAYALTIEEGTAFENKPQMSQEQLSLTTWIFKTIKEHGFEQYEISNFGSYKSSHNLGYWKYEDYMGVGAGAVGKQNNTRFYPQTDIEAYIENPLSIREELLDDEDIKIEKIFLGMRSCVGVEKSTLNKEEQQRANILLDEKKLSLKNGIYYNFEYLLADEITLFISS
jgi:oxygen-independent coproporphyrinogen-3 oxidase